MKKLSIIGCGLIGGSFAALVKKYAPEINILGIAQRSQPLLNAKKRGIIDGFELTMHPSHIESSDIIIISSPISSVLPIIEKINTIKEKKTIIEFSSIKSFLNSPIVTKSHHTIIPMHPMGGLDVQGLDNADASVLEGCPMIIFEDNQPINQWMKSCSFSLIHCPSYAIHDEWMMHVSHGPYILANALPNILSQKTDHELSQLQTVSAGGFRDTTRVSNSAIEWGLDVLWGNKHNAIAFIDQIMTSLEQLKTHLKNNHNDALNDWLTMAKKTRNKVAR